MDMSMMLYGGDHHSRLLGPGNWSLAVVLHFSLGQRKLARWTSMKYRSMNQIWSMNQLRPPRNRLGQLLVLLVDQEVDALAECRLLVYSPIWLSLALACAEALRAAARDSTSTAAA